MVKLLKVKFKNKINTRSNNLTIENIQKIMSPILTKTQIEILIFKKKKFLWKNEDTYMQSIHIKIFGKKTVSIFTK